MAGQPNVQRELRLVSEFVLQEWPRARVFFQRRLGPAPVADPTLELPEPEARFLGGHRRWVDALVVTDAAVILVEGKLEPTAGVISILQLYERLVRIDPELHPFLDRPIRKLVVWPFDDPVLAEIAAEAGVEIRVFRPPWILDELRRRRERKQGPEGRRPLPPIGPGAQRKV